MRNATACYCTLLLLEIACAAALEDLDVATDEEASSWQPEVSDGNPQRLSGVVGKAIFSALESMEQLERSNMLDQMDALQSLASEQEQLEHQEDAIEAGFDPPPVSFAPFKPTGARQVLRQEQLTGPLTSMSRGARRQRLQSLLSFGEEAQRKEQDLLQALTAEQAQLELRVQASEGRLGSIMPAFPQMPSMAQNDGGAPLSFDGVPILKAETLLKEQALIATLTSHEAQLADRIKVLAEPLQTDIATPNLHFRGREPLESLPMHDRFYNLILLLLISMVFCPFPAMVHFGILMVILMISAYFLLGRGFPADIESPMIIDWCLRILGALYILFIICVIVQIGREYLCPPPPPGEDLTTGGESSDSPAVGAQPGANAEQVGLTQNQSGSSSTAANDRERVEENRRLYVEGILLRAQPIVFGAILIIFVLMLTGMIVYVEGFYVWATYKDEPCDQPLATWLIWTLVFQMIAPLILESIRRYTTTDPGFFNNLGFAALIFIGFLVWTDCTTCHETNPYLYHYVQLYLVYNLFYWMSTILAGCGLVGLALWMQSMGLVSGGQQPAPGLIEKMETIDFREGMQPTECCICQEDFAADGKAIARTPCGHVFHKECLGEWLENFGRTCPLCRKDLEIAMDIEAGGGGKTDARKTNLFSEDLGRPVTEAVPAG